jgi:hypothetical protein
MMPKPTIALSAAVVVFTTFAAVAKDNNLPSIDIKKVCGIRAKASAEMMGDKSSEAGAFDTCMRSEQVSRDALAAAWKDIPADFKAFCITPNVYSPSYTEWISCVELGIDVKKQRQKLSQ